MSTLDADIIVVGAGMIGATVACALRDSELSVLLIDRHAPPPYPGEAYEPRVSAVNVASEMLFRSTDAWRQIAAQRTSPMRAMQVWDAEGTGMTRFDAKDIGEPQLGHIIENNVITRALIDTAVETGTVSTRWPCEVANLQEGADHIAIELADGRELRGRLVVGADGARSRIRDLAGISASVHDYEQRTLVATVRPELSHEDTAWQAFLPTGPLAFLPLCNNLCSLAWHADRDVAESLETKPVIELAAMLEDAYESRLGRIEFESNLGGFNLYRMHAHSYHGRRCVLVGDAAHAIHPLAGLGANIGFMDAATLTQVLVDNPGRDPGDQRNLRRYERWRRAQNAAVVGVTDAFKHVFGSPNSAAHALRNAGLTAANAARPAKRAVMRYAMGLDGDLPALTQR